MDTDFNISVIVKIEALGYNDTDDSKMKLMEEFIDMANLLALDEITHYLKFTNYSNNQLLV